MILADTSIWIDHLRSQNAHLTSLLVSISVGMHPCVIGELACGNLPRRSVYINEWLSLPRLMPASDNEVLSFIESNHLMGRGIGYVDMHLLAAAKLNFVSLWTRDIRVHKAALDLQIAYLPPGGYGLPS